VVGALLSLSRGLMVPTFTYKTMLIPEVGPDQNALAYGTGKDMNRQAEFFLPEMPADSLMGILPEIVRKHPDAHRSSHPILSFAGVNVDEVLLSQTMQEPLAPIGMLSKLDGIVLLAGVNHTVNTSIHYAERQAGRKQFTRWALTPQGIRECPGFPGCSDGFEQAAAYLKPITRMAKLGQATIKAIQMGPMIEILTGLIKEQPLALLCGKTDGRCEAVRQWVQEARTPAAGLPAAEMPGHFLTDTFVGETNESHD
jgi:aminoglycoside 3-N-acetyltransferase